VACRPISRQRPKFAHATTEKLLEGFSMWSAPYPALGNGPKDTHIVTTEEVFSMWSAPWPVLGNGPMNKHSYVLSVRSDQSLYNDRSSVQLRVLLWSANQGATALNT
jgi:hypothetical protein